MIKKTIMAGVLAAGLGSGLVQAQQPAAPASPHTLTGNVGLYSQYIFRGLTQTDRHPALQGGFDYSHSSGFYAGTWASNISWLRENASLNLVGFGLPNAITGTYSQGGSLEWDFYAGWKWGFAPDWTLDLGTLYYWYPGKINPVIQAAVVPFPVPKADTWEVYGGLSWKWLSGKVSYSVKDETFGVDNTSGTWYLDFSANIPLGDFAKELTGWTLMAHWGYQKFRGTDGRNTLFAIPGSIYAGGAPDNDTLFSYKDWKLGLSYALPKDFTIGAFYSRAYDTNFLGYGGVNEVIPGTGNGPFPRNLGKGTGTVYIQKTF